MFEASKLVKTKYSITIDNDDFINVFGINKCIDALEKNKNYQIASGNIHFIWQHKNKYKLANQKMQFSSYKNTNQFESIKNYMNHNNSNNGYIYYSIYLTEIFQKV